MNKKAFTLIEVMVVMAIFAIFIGMMTPMVSKWFESQEVQTTKERMNAIKIGMVGDKRLIQNGIRTSYGFVGDNGELPFCAYSSNVESGSMAILVNKPVLSCGYPNWTGPYMSGFEPSYFLKDAWGKDFSYLLCDAPDGRLLSGAIRSAGINGFFDVVYDKCDTERSDTFCQGDDVCLALDMLEVAPTNNLKGNLNYQFSNISSPFSAKIYASIPYPDAGFTNLSSAGCIDFSASAKGITLKKQIPFDSQFSMNLPVSNGVRFKSKLFNASSCAGSVKAESTETSVFISDSLSAISLDLPVVQYP